MALPTFQQMLAQTNPNGVSFGGQTTGLSTVQNATNTPGLSNAYGGPIMLGNPTFGTPPSPPNQLTAAQLAAQQAAAQQAKQQADTSAYYNDQINNLNGQVGRLDSEQNVGLGNIANAYQTSRNALDQQKAYGQQSRDLQNQTNTSSYSKNRGSIVSQTGARANALQRLLGIAGAGNSSAAYDAVPYAAGKEGSAQLSDAQDAYAGNARGIDMAWQDLLNKYTTGVSDLDQKRYGQENSLKSSIASTRASLLDQIRTAGVNKDLASGSSYQQAINNQSGYQNQVNSLLDQVTQLGNQYANPVISTGAVNYAAPTLAQYYLHNNGAIQSNNPAANGLDQSFSPLFAQKRDEFGNPIA